MPNEFISFIDRLERKTGEKALCEAVKAGYRAIFESEFGTLDAPAYHQNHIYLCSEPNFQVTIAQDSMDPNPFNFYCYGTDEADALETCVNELRNHGYDGMYEITEPEFPDDYIDLGGTWVRSDLVSVKPYDGSNIVVEDVPEEYLCYMVNGDPNPDWSEEELEDARKFIEDLPAHDMTPICGPNGDFWNVHENFRTGNTVDCSGIKNV